MERDPAVGDLLPEFRRTTGLHNWNRFAGVNYEFVSIHMDDEAGREAGYPTAFGMGSLQWSYLHNLIHVWLGTRGRIVEIGCQFRAANTKGMTVTAKGKVIGIRSAGENHLVDLEIWTEDQDGNKLAPGHAAVEVTKVREDLVS
jgi:acyl dehydratase